MKLSAYQRIVLGFVIVILLGTFLLALPISQLPTSQATLLDHLFTTTSMVCVTGLSTMAVASTYNFFGQVICVILMQIGGLGWLTIVSVTIILAKDKMALKDQFLLQDALNRQTSFHFKPFLRRLLRLTVIVQGIAALLLMFDFVKRYGLLKGIWHSIFIAVSAFCNAGFDNIGDSSLQHFVTNPLINLVVALLIIFGGLGFSVWYELIDTIPYRFKKMYRQKKWRLSHHARMVLIATLWLIIAGTVLTFVLEYNNPHTLGKLSFGEKVLASFFQSVTMRTAGFATLDYSLTQPITNFVYVLLMIIGGAPGGTAGGIKVTTVGVLVLLVLSIFKGHEQVVYRYRRLSLHIIKQALIILVFFIGVLLIGYFFLLLTNTHLSSSALWFESVSALATAGVTMGITSQLSVIGKFIIIVMMFIGRIGPVTVLLSIGKQQTKEVKRVKTTILMG